MFGDEIANLSKMLEASEAASTKSTKPSNNPALTPATLLKPVSRVPAEAAPTVAKKITKDIWDDADSVPAAVADHRKRPEFDIMFKQSVGTEDVYLGMSGKTPASFHCEYIVVKVNLPAEKIADIDLNVTEDEFSVLSSNFRLSTYLPKKVRHKEGKAQWDSTKCVLSVTLPILKDDFFS